MRRLLKLFVHAENFRPELLKLKLKAIRRGVWFKVLNRLERGLVDLSLKVVKKIRSICLAKALTSIVKKLLEALESRVRRQMRQIGISLAEKLSQIAQKWGNKTAREWVNNIGFVQYLTIMKINTYQYRA